MVHKKISISHKKGVIEEHKNNTYIHINGRHKSQHLSNYNKCKCIKHSKQKAEETSRMDLKSKKKKNYLTICCLQLIHFRFKDTNRLKVKGWKRYHANSKQIKMERLFQYLKKKKQILKEKLLAQPSKIFLNDTKYQIHDNYNHIFTKQLFSGI